MRCRKESPMKRFLIVKPSSLGDIIHAFPAVTMLAAKYPDAQIDWLAVPAFAPVVKYHPAVDNVILFRRKEMGRVSKFPGAFLTLFADIRKNRYDAVIDLQGLLRSALISRLAKSKTVAGPAVTRETLSKVFYKYKMDPGEKCRHAVCKNMSMMAEFLNEPLPERVLFEMPENSGAAKKVNALLCSFSKEKLIAVAPGARWESKQGPPEFFAECINLFTQKHPDYYFVILGSPNEKEQGEHLKRLLKTPALNLIGLTGIPELVECIRKSRLLLCNDSGPMHIAAAVGTPVAALFGPTDPVLTGPFSDKSEVLLPDLECLQCFKRTCDDYLCHNAVSAEKVVESAEKLLGF